MQTVFQTTGFCADSSTSKRNLDASRDFQNGRKFFQLPLMETEDGSHILVLSSPLFVDGGKIQS